MAVAMTDQQLQQLITALTGVGGGAQVTGAAAVVGQMTPCLLGKDRIKRYKRWIDLIMDAENKMRFMGVTTNNPKVDFVRSCAGSELTELWDKEVRARFEAIPVDGDHARLEKHCLFNLLYVTNHLFAHFGAQIFNLNELIKPTITIRQFRFGKCMLKHNCCNGKIQSKIIHTHL